jgi:hypothetical protein
VRPVSHIFSRFCIPIILLIALFSSSNLKWSEQGRKYTIISDGKGYYSYLPAAFIYRDLSFSFFDSIEAKYYDEHVKYDFRAGEPGKPIDKYFCGVAVMQIPFFLAGHAITLMSDEPADGYSKWYVILTCIGALFWLAIGLHYLRKFLHAHGAKENQSAFVLYVIFFGTNLFYYTIIEPAMSHLYSFSLVSMFLYFSKKWIDRNDKSVAVKAALVFGMIALVRPVNVLIGFWMIYEAGGVMKLWQHKLSLIRSPKHAVMSVAGVLLPFFLQMIIWKIQTGEWFYNSYGDEAFHFTQPHLIDFLFSYKKGLFVYLPITFIALFGIAHLWKKDKSKAVFVSVFLIGVTYILSCWWMWYYGGSFGTRVMVEFLPIFALLLYFLVSYTKVRAVKNTVISLIVILALFCQFQTWQYRYHIIHWSEMTKEKYWNVFGKIPGNQNDSMRH